MYGQDPISLRNRQKFRDSYAKSIYTEKILPQTPEIIKSWASGEKFIYIEKICFEKSEKSLDIRGKWAPGSKKNLYRPRGRVGTRFMALKSSSRFYMNRRENAD